MADQLQHARIVQRLKSQIRQLNIRHSFNDITSRSMQVAGLSLWTALFHHPALQSCQHQTSTASSLPVVS